MKKIIITILVALSVMSASFAQEAAENSSKGASDTANIRIGGIFNYEACGGTLGNYISGNIGGGFTAEFDLGIPLPSFMELGISGKILANGGLLKDDLLLSMMSIQVVPGFYCRLYLLNNNLIIQPEIGYGIQVNFLKDNPVYNNKIDKVYLDQLVEVSLGIRFAPQAFLDGNMEFGLTPFYILCPEQNEAVHYFGGRFGIYYQF